MGDPGAAVGQAREVVRVREAVERRDARGDRRTARPGRSRPTARRPRGRPTAGRARRARPRPARCRGRRRRAWRRARCRARRRRPPTLFSGSTPWWAAIASTTVCGAPEPCASDGAGDGVVDAERRALAQGAGGAARDVAGELVGRLLAEGQRDDELAEVVQEPGEVAVGAGVAAGRGDGGAGPGDGQRVQVHLAAHDRAVAGHRLQEPVGAGLQRELADAQPADHDDRLAHALRLQRPRGGGGVHVAEQVRREGAVRLDGRDDVAGRRLGIVRQRDDARDRPREHRQRAEAGHRGIDAGAREISRGGICGGHCSWLPSQAPVRGSGPAPHRHRRASP